MSLAQQRLFAMLERRDVQLVASLVALPIIAWHVYRKIPEAATFGLDAHAYWAVDPAAPYGQTVGTVEAFLYAPPLVPVFGVLNDLPWPVFHALWLVLQVAVLVWMARGWTVVALAIPPVFNELFFGNINLFLAAAIVVGFTFSATWAFVILTKVTPGIGLLWFAARRAWRQVAIALAVTAAIVGVSFVLTPELWFDWIGILAASDSMSSATAYGVPLLPRLGAAAAILWWGGLRNHRWTVPIGVTLALPVIWSAGLSILVAVIPLLRHRFELEAASDDPMQPTASVAELPSRERVNDT